MGKNKLFFIGVIILSVAIYVEFQIKSDMYENEKISDLKLHYKSKIGFNDKIINALFIDLFKDNEMKNLIYKANKNEEKNENRKKLSILYSSKYKELKKAGIEQLHFHLANGESFFRFHKPEKFGDNLIFRDSIKKVIDTKKKVMGFEVGKYFNGFRYIYPLFFKGEYIGSVEASINTSHLLAEIKEILEAKFNLVLKANKLDKMVEKSYVKENYHTFCADSSYFMANSIHTDENLFESTLIKIKNKIYQSMKTNKPFVHFARDKNYDINVFTFIPIVDVNNKKIGYFFSGKEDNTIYKVAILQIVKYIIALILFTLLFYFYKQNKNKTNTIEQLQKAIDLTTLVSKTDRKGKITYANEAFIKLSGYSKSELIGKGHNIIREPSVPKEMFKELWKTINSKKIWKGTFPNRAKDGSKYIVDATIIPILDINDEIEEFVAIRHDVTELENYKEILKEQLDDTSKSLKYNINYTKQYEDALNNSIAVLKTDTNNIITKANDRFCEISGYSLDELSGKNCKELRHEEHIKNEDCVKIAQKMKNKEIVSIILKNISKNGEMFFSNTLIYPIVDLNSNVVEHLHLMHDITEIINLHQELEDTQKEIIYKMGEIGETRSKETGNHVKRVAEYSKLLAVLSGLSEKEADILKLASPMHDIGKVGIPDSILKKPGKLDVAEWKVMQTHSEIGFEMLKHSTRPILKAAAIVAGEHHEKWDGSGYPKGLEGDNIHIYGRITAIADVFDALGSDRCYKKSWDLAKILELFKEESGKHFDPKLIKLFLDNLDKFLEIREKFED